MLKTLHAVYRRISLCIMFNRGVVPWLCSVEVVDDDIIFGPSCTHSGCWVRGATCHDAGTSRKSEIWRALWWRDPFSHHSRSSQCVCPVTLQYGALWHSAWQAADSKPFGLVLLRPLFHKKRQFYLGLRSQPSEALWKNKSCFRPVMVAECSAGTQMSLTHFVP